MSIYYSRVSDSKPFVTVARVGDIADGHGRQVTVHERWVGLFNLRGEYHALDNLCLHRGGPLSDGVVANCIVTCPWHGWQFDVRTGMCVQDPGVGVTRHEARIVGNEIQVKLTD
jgi:nitrite reductase (NADH) small subunit